ncbi:MAG: alpha/beta fold hydrolase, partial [Bauldia sp.]|nr:alpha/beta fold hydrolase [Bauldia sp.]
RPHIVGLSLGGMTAQALASRHPERVASLVLIATAAHLPPPEFWHGRAATVRADGPAAVVDAIIPRWFTAAFRERAPEAVARVRQGFMSIDRAGYARCCEAIAAMDLRQRLGKIAAPTLVMVGADDPVTTPAMADALRAGIPGAELVVLANVAHLVSVERPDAVAACVLAFLGSNEETAVSDAGGFQKGLAVRKSVLGADYVDAALKDAGSFGAGWQDFITRVAWGEIWGDPALPRKTRSLLTLAMMIALHREEEFKLHVRPALGNGVSIDELRALIKQAAVYAGVPAANAAMRWTREVLGEELK